ncbi:protease B nonderepressible form [Emydomyces testavorans]|uniref:Protein PBN1 n=1 Tax=Emydomyces testavorans TaxID=2070801 RepID=A0AAF0IHA0_9EURO|nr:protease B nonderepressible form [Emydomyces testavorans]
MKRRITLIHDAEGEFDPQQAHLTSNSVSIRSLHGARQERLTFELQELPNEKTFGVDSKCTVPESSFIPLNDVAKSGELPYLQFYQILPSLDPLVTYIREAICSKEDAPCRDGASLIRFADTLDIDYDRVLNSFAITVYWSKPVGKGGWDDTVYNHQPNKDKVDIGILAPQPPLEPDELRLGGFLAVLGRDKELTRFSTPTGLHPTLSLSIPQSALSPPPAPSDTVCGLYTYITLPSHLFADKYQLSTTDPLFLQSHNLRSLHHMAGETDLEAPDWVTRRWGSHLLMELATPKPNKKDTKKPKKTSSDDWEIAIPLHLRYLHPSKSGYRNVSAPWPLVFWACTSDDTSKMGINPFDRTHLAWDDLFGAKKTYFYQFHPSPEPVTTNEPAEVPKLVETIQVPVLRINEDAKFMANQARQIEFGTVGVILVGFFWVLWKLGVVVRISGVRSNQALRTRETEKNKTQ